MFFPLHNLKHHMCTCSSGMWIYLLLYRRCQMRLSHGFICLNGVFVVAVLPPLRLPAFPLDLVLAVGVSPRLFSATVCETLLPSYQRSAPAFRMFLAQRQQSRHYIAADFFFVAVVLFCTTQSIVHCDILLIPRSVFWVHLHFTAQLLIVAVCNLQANTRYH